MADSIHPALTPYLRRSKRLHNFFSSLDPSTLDWIRHLLQRPKTEKTRKKIAGEIAEWLTETMEAERDLPPLISTSLARNPRSRQAWEKMPASLRRKYLLGILYSRYPETRARSLKRMMEEIARPVGRAKATKEE